MVKIFSFDSTHLTPLLVHSIGQYLPTNCINFSLCLLAIKGGIDEIYRIDLIIVRHRKPLNNRLVRERTPSTELQANHNYSEFE